MTEVQDKKPTDVIQDSIGVFGRWHWWVVLWICACKFAVAWHQMSIVFQAPNVNFTCSDPNITDRCSESCPYHDFDRSVFTETITTQWDLVCDRYQLNNVVQLTTMFGILVGALLFGIISDRYGRRGPLIAAVIIQAFSGSAAAFVPWLWAHIVLRFICTTATGGTMMASFVLIMEIVGLKWRTTAGILYQIPFNLGHLTLPLIAYFIRDWRFNQFFISVTSVILFSYYWVLPESPRWLITVGRPTEAVEILERAAYRNGLPTENIKDRVTTYIEKSDLKPQTGGNILLLVKTPNLRKRSFCICVNWLVTGMCFFGVAQYIGHLGGNMFLNVAISAVVQIPGTVISIFAVEKLGRKRTLVGSSTVTGISCLAIALCSEELNWLKVFLATMGIFGLSVTFPTIYIYAGELFPTLVRNVGCGTASVFARVGSMVAPFIAKSTLPAWTGPVIFGTAPLISGLLCLLILPETLNCKLPDTIEEAEEFGTKKSQESQ